MPQGSGDRGQMAENDLGVTFGRAFFMGDDLLGVLRDRARCDGIAQKACNGLSKFVGGGDLDHCAGGTEAGHGVGEVAGVGADDDGFGQGGRLDHVRAVLARAEIDKGSADEDDGGKAVEFAEFAHGVAEDDRRDFRFSIFDFRLCGAAEQVEAL